LPIHQSQPCRGRKAHPACFLVEVLQKPNLILTKPFFALRQKQKEDHVAEVIHYPANHDDFLREALRKQHHAPIQG
jgi:hypothetical protein